jgi:Zn-finger nucleic acid-binding protein
MQCPVWKTVHLTMAERSGIEIDYCPQCRGVWLDRGELDKIIERAAPTAAPQAAAPAPQYAPPPAHAQAPY